jgi:CubicO group peptidase (beta-lactamase class C family)
VADLESYRQQLQTRLDELCAEYKVPGASLGIILGDESLEVPSGVVNLNTGVETTSDTLFQIGSITKVYTATMVMQLVDEGKVALDEPVSKYLPELSLEDAEAAKTITVRQLLTHTSGIDGDLFEDFGRGDDCVEKYVASFPTLAQSAPPGTFFSYCNSGFVLAGRLIEKIDGVGFDAALKTRVLGPIGAARSSMLPEEAILHRVSVGHFVAPGTDAPMVAPMWLLPRALGPAGLIAAPVADLLAFAKMHLDGGVAADGTRVLSEESVKAMQVPQVELKDPYTLGQAWGLGWIIYRWGDEPVVGHDGSTIGQNAFLRVVPERKLAIGLLTNASGGLAVYEKIYDEIFRELTGMAMPEKPKAAADQSTFDLSPFEGVFERLGVRMTFSIPTEGEGAGKLHMQTEATGPLARQEQANPPVVLDVVDDTTFIAFIKDAGVYMPVVFFDFDEKTKQPTWVHMGGRATKRV